VKNRLVGRVATFLMCVGAVAEVFGCGTEDDELGLVESSATVCTTVGSTWWNQAFADQTGQFHVEFDATPSGTAVDAVVGLSAGPASAYSGLAAIVRFNTSGTLDARAGDQYRADETWSYQAGVTYHIRMDVDVKTHTYSAYVRIGSGPYDAIARSIPFRTEQASVTHLANAASKLDSPGSLQVCGMIVVTDATSVDGCTTASAGDGFVSIPAPDATVLDTFAFYATPSAENVDAVIGFSAGPATGFSSLATAVRFYTNGYMDARDGGSYRADVQRPYGAAQQAVRMIADVTSHTYSVFVGTSDSQELARQYHFRTEQQAVTHLDHIALMVDSSEGSVTVCPALGTPLASRGVAYSREGRWNVAPLASGAIMSDGASTVHVDGHDAALATIPRGGRVAVDAGGNVWIARAADGTLTVEKLSPALASLWTTSIAISSNSRVTALSVTATGAPAVGLVDAATSNVDAIYFTSGGGFDHIAAYPGYVIALDRDDAIISYDDGAGNVFVEKHAPSGDAVWWRRFSGSASVSTLAPAPDGGVVFGGELLAPTDFGGGTLQTYFNENGGENGFVARLDGTGAHVFSQRVGYAYVDGVATNGQRIAISGTERTQFYYQQFGVVDMTGAPAADAPSFDSGFGEHGQGRETFVAADGRIWWNTTTIGTFAGGDYLLAL
jgi:hypothetical protein